MRHRRAAAALICSVLVAATAALPGPASALETPRLLGVTIAVDTGQVPNVVTTTFRFAGAVGGVDPEWGHTFADGHVQTVSSGGYGVNPGLSQYDLSFPVKSYYAQGLWTLRSVKVTSADGAITQRFGLGGPTPIPGVAPTFTLATGPTTLAEIAADAGTVTSAVLGSPSVDPKTVDGVTGSIRTELGYSAPTLDASFQPVFRLVGTDIYRGPAGFGVGAASGTLMATMAASQFKWGQGATWRFERILVRSGPVTRIYYADGTVSTYVQLHSQLNTGPADCTGYLGGMTYSPADPGCAALPTVAHSLAALGAAASEFTVTGLQTPPLGPPELTVATVSKKSVAIGGTVTFSATYTDPDSLPSTNSELAVEGKVGTLSLTRLSSSTSGCTASAPYVCTVSVTYKVPTDARPGTYVLAGLWTADAHNFTAYYTPTGDISTWWGPKITTPLAPNSPHVATLGFTVTGTPTVDTVAPVLTSIARTSPAVVDGTNPGGDPTSGTWHWTGTDTGGSGIIGVRVDLLSPTLSYEQTASWDAPGNVPATSGDAVLNSFQVSDWVVRYVTIIDAQGNARRYDADGQIVPGTTRHTFDLASAGLSILSGPVTPGVPSAPRALTASGRDGTLVATWAAPKSVGTSPVSYYNVTLQPGGATTNVTSPIVSFTGLTNETGYTVTVVAHNAAGPGPIAWIPGTWVHPVAPLNAPSIGAVAPIIRTASVAFTGGKVSSLLGAPVTGYQTQVRRALVGVRLPSSWTTLPGVRPAPSGSVTAIKPGERVCLRVAAVNAIGATGSATRCTVALADDRSLAAATKGWSRVALAGAYLKTVTTSKTVGSRLLSGAAYGSAINLAVRTIPGGGTVGVYVGSKLVATWSLASTKAAFVTKTVVTVLAGQHVTVKVLKAGKAGVVIDGWAVRA